MAIGVVRAHPHRQQLQPLRAAILAVSAKCGAGASSAGGMHISPPIVEPIVVAAARQERVGVLRQHAGLLRLGAGVDLDEQQRAGGPAWRSPWPAPRTGSAGRPNGWRRTARPPPWPCSTAAARSCAAQDPACAPAAPAILPWPPARGSRRTRVCPAAITGSMASASKVFDTATSVTRGGIAPGLAAGALDLLPHRGEAGRGAGSGVFTHPA